MSFEILVLEEAENDLDEAFLYYEMRKTGLGEELIEYIKDSFSFIQKHPKASEKNTRTCFCTK